MEEQQRVKAMKIAEELGNEYMEMLKENFDANLPKVLREYVCRNVYIADEKAMQVFEEALEVARENLVGIAKAEALGYIAEELSKVNSEKAVQVFREALDVALNVPRESLTRYLGLLLSFTTQEGDYHKVMQYLEDAKKMAKTEELREEIRRVMIEMERIDPERFRYGELKELKNRILNIAERLLRGE